VIQNRVPYIKDLRVGNLGMLARTLYKYNFLKVSGASVKAFSMSTSKTSKSVDKASPFTSVVVEAVRKLYVWTSVSFIRDTDYLKLSRAAC